MRLISSWFARSFVLLFGALALSACGSNPNSAEVRWRVTVEVATPEGMRTGSSVWSWSLSRPTVALASAYDGEFRGEAVAVDLPNGKTLFALVKGQEMIPERQFRDLLPQREREDRVADILDIAANTGSTRQLPCVPKPEKGGYAFKYDCMMLVSFADAGDPTSVFEIDYHDAADSLGEGYTIQAITITITDQEVTTGIGERLRETGIKPNSSLDNDFDMTTNPTLAQMLGYTDFVRGTSK
ncbi:hypothetical protein [Qipengyuania sp. DGS5-3]|uniref:hypothetical protein n=1 Tax=Qipengyuania sp. DGS5-3 TaxID=3349632 RepID=UPI0036D2B287